MPEPASKLSDEETASRLRSLRGWEIKQAKLTKAFKFDAESEGRHPDLQVGWGKAVVS